jgi:hypothetical protein
MPPTTIRINNATFPVFRTVSNPLKPAIARDWGLQSVDVDIIHSDLRALSAPLGGPETHGLIYYAATRPNLADPITVSTAARLDERPHGTYLQTLNRASGQWQPLPYTFDLAGTVGCTAVVNLGFFLLGQLQSIASDQLGVLVLLDQKAMASRLESDLPIADEAILEFCRSRNTQRLARAADRGDCHYYVECETQQGWCDLEQAKCKRSKK